MTSGLKIGELAQRAGVTAKAIRFYERKGVLPPAKRAPTGYRLYGDDAVEMLCFVKQATGLGLTLAEIKDIIAIRRGGRPPCAHVHRLLRDKAALINKVINPSRPIDMMAEYGAGRAAAAAEARGGVAAVG
jgi:DNA-binding transcriptional MerR regulator